MKTNTTSPAYFFHDSDMRGDIKILAVRRKFGTEGYAVWCMVLERMCAARNLKLSYAPVDIEIMAGDFMIDTDRLKVIITYFVKLGLLNLEENELYSAKLFERMQVFDIKEDRGTYKTRGERSDIEIFNEVVDEIRNSHIWIQDIERMKKLSEGQVINYLVEFLQDLRLKEDYFKSIGEIKRHFVNYLNRRLRGGN